jgi:hypothetical protein
MSTMRILCLMAVAACGATTAGTTAQPPARDLSQFSDKTFAPEGLCESAVTNFEDKQFESTSTPVAKKELFDRTRHEVEHRARVQKCTATLTERQAACVASAESLQYIHNCERFAELQ